MKKEPQTKNNYSIERKCIGCFGTGIINKGTSVEEPCPFCHKEEECKKGCTEHKYHCGICNAPLTYSPQNFASRPQDIPNPCPNGCFLPATDQKEECLDEFCSCHTKHHWKTCCADCRSLPAPDEVGWKKKLKLLPQLYKASKGDILAIEQFIEKVVEIERQKAVADYLESEEGKIYQDYLQIRNYSVSRWKEEGIKRGYDKYFGIEWDRNCACEEPQPEGEPMVGQGEGNFRNCKRCKGRIWK